MTLAQDKADLRRRMRLVRAALSDPEPRSTAATERLIALPEVGNVATAFVFRSFGSEISTLGLLDALAARGIRLMLPVLVDGRLEAAAYAPGDPLVPSGYGALEPGQRRLAEPATVDMIVAPGLAFDPKGHRLGYGGGYYDGFLRRVRPDAARIGFGFDDQIVDAVPHDDDDEPLRSVVTDRRVLFIAPGRTTNRED
jgi:5-formyltetrahydrofolate cyclo-ligase